MRLLTGLTSLVLAAGLAGPALAGSIVIDGRGEVSAAPDTAFITSGVTTQGATAREALDANNEAMQALIEELRGAGIEARDIQTSGFSVNPNYVYSDARDPDGYTRPPRVSGYIVTNSVTVRVRDLDSLGSVLDNAVTVGANTINGVSFTVDDPTALYDEARRQAFADARARAELYAELAGERLGAIETIRESQAFAPPPQPYAVRNMVQAEAAASVPVQTGELAFAITVTVEWELEDD